MLETTLLIAILCMGAVWFYIGNKSATNLKASSNVKLHSLPHYHGLYLGLISSLPSLVIVLTLMIGDDYIFAKMILREIPKEITDIDNLNKLIAVEQIKNVINGMNFITPPIWVSDAAEVWSSWDNKLKIIMTTLGVSCSIGFGLWGYQNLISSFRARNRVESIVLILLAISSGVAILTTLGILFSVAFESFRFFAIIPIQEFLFGTIWNPQFEGAERAGSGQQGLSEYGSLPLFAGTFLISLIALVIAVPIGLFSAIYLSEYAKKKERAILKPVLEILAGVPTVVYGFFAALTVAPLLRSTGFSLGLDVASESALAAGFVMGIMIIPFVSSLSDDVINAVPQSLRDAAYGLGSTKGETVLQVVLPAALPGVVASILLAVSRAVGETMIVVMAAGLAANLSLNPFDAVTTVTAQIVTILVGDQEFESAKTLSAFALALTLIVITLILNLFALQVVKKYREQYE
ncbi:MAG: phosphate ABC transporter permease subunit PstC [Proteobacteria bacterium]|nr:phosphate ABC transporter permease subunit PstC [Pseudomonadota bacterium]MDA1238700.1 phosphate ABC transporter permease subunit PstC [Pseudomonadota bacterium]